MKTILQIESIEAEEFLARLDRIEAALIRLYTPSQTPQMPVFGSDLLSRRDVADLFDITLVTVHEWTRKGILQAHKIGNRVYYKRAEVEITLIKKR